MAVVVAVVVFTGGTAIPAVAGALAAAGMAFAGGMIMGAIGIAGKAASDIVDGAVSDMSSYMSVGARESFVGALSGAIFDPYGAFKSYKGMMALGGLTNGVESLIRQTLEGKGINFKTLMLDAGIGALTAGAFHGAGKLFQKASPFVKNAFSKIALKNMKKRPKSVVLGSNFGNVDEALGRFTKEFKKVKRGVGGAGKADIVEVKISRSKYPESAKHIEDAIANGHPDVLTINRGGAKPNRRASLKGIDKVLGKDLDEYPPAMFEEGGKGASVRPINPSDNRGSGSSIGHKLRPYPNGTNIKYKITDD
ncbi:NucA/NucB deoxyribonuclease domain-containing protein [Clostridium estertheticum]|uniref:NucA/NucB deoxyribonuclease domain-containing protein n=1 Tax=Clostridium estertheticum TaxID=238834 RepID=UPI001CF4696A|nr:NucA/NucB deoxyribonuclease domain-containing protein [Clostridium estertheticum]MCB2357284.1 hypothetical protein [Clostridium estertheticum]WAG43350.1 hypothetical protein LL065_11995 [Clostridium estertheticum]